MRISLLSLVLLFLTGCRPANDAHAVEMPPLDVPVATPLERSIADVEEYTGKIMSVERVNVMARVDGYLSEIRIKPGELVKTGDLLFVIDRRPYQALYGVAQEQLQQAEARVLRLSKDLKRIETLVQSNAGTQED